ncbi:integrase core domain-containing protein [Chromohalobacter nigrandesensis]|uniref:integrase core domain-containing protein n=1 Tax=Chromohalobacter nigrandesensis TaxID=119863 RepID=UPI003CCFEFE4
MANKHGGARNIAECCQPPVRCLEPMSPNTATTCSPGSRARPIAAASTTNWSSTTPATAAGAVRWRVSLGQPRIVINRWIRCYNETRPHQSLDYVVYRVHPALTA